MNENKSRLNRFQKQRKTTKIITILVIVGTILLLFLLGTFIFGDGNKEDTGEEKVEKENEDIVITEPDKKDETAEKKESKKDEEKDSNEEEEEKLKKENTEPSDSNVSEAYTANWDPVTTEQEGEHTTQFKKESQDWVEMEKAASNAAEIDPDNMITWMIENGGAPDKTIATVSDNNETEVYRVFLTWIDNKGWQPKKVEILKQNDKK